MRIETQKHWLDRTLKHLAAGTTDMAETVTRIDLARYVDPARLEAEQQQVLRRHPVIVGYSSQVAKPGDCLTHDLLGLPILVTRDREGRLHAFLNICRHRGTRLVWERGTCAKRSLVCPYHAWTYDLSGRLLGLPHEKDFGLADKAAMNLVRLPVTEAFGVVLAVPTPGETFDFDAFLGPVKADLEGFGLGGHVVYDQREIGLSANWKVIIEGALETYHVRYAHAQTIAPMFNDNISVMERLEPHARLYFTKRAIKDLAGRPLDGQSVRDYGNPLYFIFPNLTVLVQPDHATVLAVFPKGVDDCVVMGATLIPDPAASEKARSHWDKNVKIFWDALDEDFQMGQSIQAGIRSGANTHATFGRFEHACGWFHDSLDRRLKS